MMNVFARGGLLRDLAPPGLIDLADKEIWKGLNERPFAFAHRLAHHPLFTLPRLAQLSELAFDRADYARYVTAKERSLPKVDLKRRLHEDILNIASNGKWIGLHYIDEMHEDYANLYESLLVDIEQLTGFPVRRRMEWGSMSVFMAAPGLVTPYHFDHDTNFLMQVQGEKEVRLYPRGLATLTLEEIEDFYHYNPGAGRYRDDLASSGESFFLKPGGAVHHPPLAAHHVQNGPGVSVSVAIYYVTLEMEDQARVHQANYCLRRGGLRPRPVGASPFWDGIKSGVMKGLSKSRPQTHDDMLYSGILSVRAPLQFAKTLKQRVVDRLRRASARISSPP